MKGVRAVVIGASAGGVAALFTVLGSLPAGFDFPVMCVLHLPCLLYTSDAADD